MSKTLKLQIELDAIAVANKGVGELLRDIKLGGEGELIHDPGDGPWGLQVVGTWEEVSDEQDTTERNES